MKKITILAVFASLLATACYNEGILTTNPAPLMQHQFKPTQASLLAVAKTYAEAINDNLDHQRLHPGQYADYGVALAQLGCAQQANIMFNNEKMLFPNSIQYVDYLKKKLTPFYASDNHADTTHINLPTLDTIHITLTPEEIALQQQIESDPEYQRMQKQLQKKSVSRKSAQPRKNVPRKSVPPPRNKPRKKKL